ncbi:MAG: Wzz/FepE/Etk N-terminal domain-containing protein [Anaerococcus sp.]|uniref:YveK family protein n=1 Tax=Anaerococcus sp. TaxID=1872515 RepID=UPI0028FEA249|nr:Wzz/FepE/Etk N-terminal domain-containing protein [Anaerococcus sp.]MDU1865158.1 Wzz/FepE/Etk N-terminal domain-containing protein [Anaerococcus sp.]
MFFDYYGRDIFVLPHSGADTENFYNTGLLYMNSDKIWSENLFGGVYSKLIGITLKSIGDCKLFIQYINIVLAIFTIFIFIKILKNLNINSRLRNILILILCYFPNNMIISSLILRESWIIFLLTIGIYFYIIYIYNKKQINLFLSAIFIILSSLFHSGMILVLVAILIGELINSKGRYIIADILLFFFMLIILYKFRDVIFSKFITQKEIILSRDDYIEEAGSRYLSSIYINNVSEVIKFGWLKAIYFIASPTILYWRGLTDIVSFFLDSLLYIIITVKIIFKKGELPSKINTIYKTFILALIFTVFVFGIGTSTAGTAIRHRNKLLIIFLILLAIIENYKVNIGIIEERRNSMDKSESNSIPNLLKYIKRNIPIILILTILFGGVGYIITKYVITPTYSSNTTMMVGIANQNNENNQEDNMNFNQIQANKALISTYSEIVKSKGIADKVINNLKLNMDYSEFSKKVSIEPVKDTQIISVKVVDTIPERSCDIANETATIFKDTIGDIMKVDNVQILDGATLPNSPSSPNIFKNTIISLILGLILGLVIAIFKEIKDTSVNSQEQVMEYFDIPVIGVIPDKKQG